jgi:excisionase family DNA binding protein
MTTKKKSLKKKRNDSRVAGFSFMSLMDSDDLDPAADEFLTVAQAAKVRGTSRIAIHDLIARGRLKAVTIAGRRFISREALDSFERQSPPGRPKRKGGAETKH